MKGEEGEGLTSDLNQGIKNVVCNQKLPSLSLPGLDNDEQPREREKERSVVFGESGVLLV